MLSKQFLVYTHMCVYLFIITSSLKIFFRSGKGSYGDSTVGYVKLKRDGNACIVIGKICPEHKIHTKL